VPSIFDGIDHCSFTVHPFESLAHIFIKMHTLEEPVEQPVQKNARLMIEYKWIKGFFFRHNGIPWVVYLYLFMRSYIHKPILASNKSSGVKL
jgi:hypothetical protein